jgi:two-component sensor histidine kinase
MTIWSIFVLGIIVNELVSNSLKHAFPDRDKGEIRIIIHREENGKSINSIEEIKNAKAMENL